MSFLYRTTEDYRLFYLRKVLLLFPNIKMLLSTWEVLSAWKYKCCTTEILLFIRSHIITHARLICVSLKKKKKKKNNTVYFWKWGFMEWYELWLCADAGKKTFWETENKVSIFEVCKKHQSGIITILSLLPQSFPLSLHLAFGRSLWWRKS